MWSTERARTLRATVGVTQEWLNSGVEMGSALDWVTGAERARVRWLKVVVGVAQELISEEIRRGLPCTG